MGLIDQRTTKGKIKKNFLILLYGPEKVGKTTFASELPTPYFICGEEGTDHLDVNRIRPNNWVEFKTILKEIRDGDYSFKTVVIDTIDWIEELLLTHLRAVEHVTNIKDVGGGWGAYKTRLKQEWHELFILVDSVRKKMNICFLAHSQCKRFSDPQLSCEYDRYELKMEFPEVSSVFKEYVDAILFANYETVAKQDKKTKKIRAYGDNTRLLYTERTHAYDAGNRYGMPAEMELNSQEVLKYVNETDEDASKRLLNQVDDLLGSFTNETYIKTVSSYIEKVKEDPKKLRAVINKLKLKLSEEE